MSWPQIRLGDLSKVITKGTTPTTLGFEFSAKGVNFLRVQNIEDGAVKYWKDTLFIDERTHQALERSQILPGDVLVSIAGTIGRSGVVPGDAPPLNCNQAIAIVRTNGEICRPYLRYWLESAEAQGQMRGATVTGTISNLSLTEIGNLRVPVPSLAEQQRIAEILDHAEALRVKRRAALAQLDTLTQSIFLDLFGDPRTNPKGWPLRPMAELFTDPPIFGTMIPADGQRLGWLVLRVANIQDWKLDLTDKKYADLPSQGVARHSVKDGDLLLARAIASEEHLGKCVVAHPGAERWAFDSHLMRLRFDGKQAEPDFIRHLLMTPGGRSRFLRASRKSTIQFNINTKEISGLRIPVPLIEDQREFLRCVVAIEKSRAGHRASLAQLDVLFGSVQHRAFRGEL